MNSRTRVSRIGLAVVKLAVDGASQFLMRRNKKWKDISFIGGHESERDGHRLLRAAHRELLEEVPSLRRLQGIVLEPLIGELCYGPIFSKSANIETIYELQFFLVKFLTSPENAIQSIGPRTANVLIGMEELKTNARRNVSNLVDLLSWAYPGGMDALPLSWPDDLHLTNSIAAKNKAGQFELSFQVGK